MVSALRGDVDRATDLLQASGPFFEQHMGPNNPFSSEACYAAGRMQLLAVLTGGIDMEDLLPPEEERTGTREEQEQAVIDSIVKVGMSCNYASTTLRQSPCTVCASC